MKILFSFIFLLSTSVSHAFDVKEFLFGKKEKRVNCKDGAGSQHTNPDNSLGGFVAKTAKVEAGAFIASGAQVCEFAQVKSGAKILGNAVISGRAQIASGVEISGFAQVMGEAKLSGNTKISGSVIIEGSPQISGSTTITSLAKVTGGSKIHNAIICQASQIENFDVIDSDYYCQTEDPEPPHPGEMGMKSLLGVDTDLDGVRDDLEIWINAKFSNTESVNNKELRMAFKERSKRDQLIFKFKNNKEKVIELTKEKSKINQCAMFHSKLSSRVEFYRIKDEYNAMLVNTRERNKVFWDIQKYFAGMGSFIDKRGKDACN